MAEAATIGVHPREVSASGSPSLTLGRSEPPVLHLQGAARAFLRQTGYEPRWMAGPRTAKAHLHDTAFHCVNCDDWFRALSDMAEDREHECFWCRWNYRKPAQRAA